MSNIFKPRSKEHRKHDEEWPTMDLKTIALRRRELTSKNYPSEAWFLKLMNENGIGGYRRNMPILSRFFGDFVWRRAKVVVEIDGKSHSGKAEYDAKRDAFISSFGVKIFRIQFGDTSAAMEVIDNLKALKLGGKIGFKAKSH